VLCFNARMGEASLPHPEPVNNNQDLPRDQICTTAMTQCWFNRLKFVAISE